MWKWRRRRNTRQGGRAPVPARSRTEPVHYCFITRPGEHAPTLKQLRAVDRTTEREAG
jgi:hypothetical protein